VVNEMALESVNRKATGREEPAEKEGGKKQMGRFQEAPHGAGNSKKNGRPFEEVPKDETTTAP